MSDYWAATAPPPRPPRRRGPPSAATVGAAVASATAAVPGLLAIRAGLRVFEADEDLFLVVAPIVGLLLLAFGAVLTVATLAVPIALLTRWRGARIAAYVVAVPVLGTALLFAFDGDAPGAVRQVGALCAVGAVATVALLSTPAAREDFVD